MRGRSFLDAPDLLDAKYFRGAVNVDSCSIEHDAQGTALTASMAKARMDRLHLWGRVVCYGAIVPQRLEVLPQDRSHCPYLSELELALIALHTSEMTGSTGQVHTLTCIASFPSCSPEE